MVLARCQKLLALFLSHSIKEEGWSGGSRKFISTCNYQNMQNVLGAMAKAENSIGKQLGKHFTFQRACNINLHKCSIYVSEHFYAVK